jgi:hypothetical protein
MQLMVARDGREGQARWTTGIEHTINFCYWRFGTLAMWQFGGSAWKTWQEHLEKTLLPNQRTRADGEGGSGACEAGSWDPIDEWSLVGGRVYATAMGALTLEVGY